LSSDALYNYIFLCHVCLSVCMSVHPYNTCMSCIWFTLNNLCAL
jgi:hypothetical protein